MRVMPEHLMNAVVDDALRRGICLYPSYPRWKRVWLEPFFNLLGLAFGQALVMLPWPLRRRADARILSRLARNRTAVPADFPSRMQETVAMAQRLRQETGCWPAALIFTSHPPTIGPLEWLRFELLRLGLLLANALVDERATEPLEAQGSRLGTTTPLPGASSLEPRAPFMRPPQCLLAIDPFALDTLRTPIAGFYAGWMHRIYLAWDRQSASQGRLQRRFLLRRTGYPYIAWRLLRRLRSDVAVLMVLAGGLPYNARLLYAAKEFVQRLPVKRWPFPRRQAQKIMMDILIRPKGGMLPAEEGRVPERARAQIEGLLGELGIQAADRGRLLEEFQAEFRRAIPYRERLFNFLINRLARKNKPLLLIAIAHSEQPPYARIALPWGVFSDSQGRLQWLKGPDAAVEPLPEVNAFAKEFSRLF